MSMTRRVLTSVLLAAAIAGCAVLVWVTPSGSAERVLGALLLLFVLPGAALGRLLWPPEARQSGAGLLLSPALSVALVILDSAVLHVSGIRLQQRSWTASIGAIGVALCVLGIFWPRTVSPRRDRRRFPRAGLVAPLVAAVVLSGAILAGSGLITAGSVRHQQRVDHFTELWMLPAASGAHTATIGIYNHEGATRTFLTRYYLNGHFKFRRSVVVAANRSWTTTESFPARSKRVRVTIASPGDPGSVLHSVRIRWTV
jgi:hypothetical protein